MKKMLVTLLLATMALQLLAQPTPWRSPSTGKWGFKEGNTWGSHGRGHRCHRPGGHYRKDL